MGDGNRVGITGVVTDGPAAVEEDDAVYVGVRITEPEPRVVTVVCRGTLGTVALTYLTRGSRVCVQGALISRDVEVEELILLASSSGKEHV